jgi:putative transposase
MSRPLRIEYSDAWYHVMNRGRRGEEIFSDHNHYHYFVQLLQESVRMWKVRIAAFCLMPTHYHLLIQTPEANLSRCMRHIDGVYTQRYNRIHRCDGSLFRGRYKAILIEADSYLLQLLRYIHRNPLRAGRVKDLGAYEWSSHVGYLSNAKRWNWLYKGFALSMLNKERSQQWGDYRRFVSQEDPKGIVRILESRKCPSILGSEGFMRWVKEKFFLGMQHPEIPESRVLAPDVEAIKDTVCEVYEIKRDRLLRVQRGRFNEPRNVAIYLTRELRGATLEEVCRAFHMSRYSSASSAIGRLKVQMARDRQLQRRIEEIREKVCKRQT